MRFLVIAIAVASLHAGCKEVECGEGTIERDGKCQSADTTIDTTKCGENTMAVGDSCVPLFPPTVCDIATTEEEVDSSTNVTTCIGTGGGGCGAALACPTPSAGKQTICGQLFDFESGDPFAATGSAGVRCDPSAPATSGPCALHINAYDAIMFAMNPMTAPLPVGDLYIDDCGRFRLTDVTTPAASPFIALGIDDIDPTKRGPMGVTNATGIALNTAPNMATKDIEAFTVPISTYGKWQATGGPSLATGIYAMVFRAKRAPSKQPQAGVAVLKGGVAAPADDHYFVATDTTRERIDTAAAVTGANGTALVTNVSLGAGPTNTGTQGPLPPECRWSAHAAQTLAGIVFIQILRPVNATGMTCNL